METEEPKPQQNNLKIVIPEKMDIDCTKGLLQQFEALPRSADSITVDFSNCGYVNSAGLGTLLILQEKAENYNQKIILKDLSDGVLELITVSGFDKLFEIK